MARGAAAMRREHVRRNRGDDLGRRDAPRLDAAKRRRIDGARDALGEGLARYRGHLREECGGLAGAFRHDRQQRVVVDDELDGDRAVLPERLQDLVRPDRHREAPPRAQIGQPLEQPLLLRPPRRRRGGDLLGQASPCAPRPAWEGVRS